MEAQAVPEVLQVVHQAGAVVKGKNECRFMILNNLIHSAMKRIHYIIILLFLSSTAFGQTFADALTLSNTQIHGTARSAAMGNAIGALGGDFTSLSINPAGIGFYQTSEFTFTPSFSFNESEIQLGGQKFSDNEFKFNLDQVGYVGSMKLTNSSSSIVSFNFGVGFNKLADFNSSAMGMFDQSSVSFLDGIVDYANTEALSNEYLERQIGSIEYRDWQPKLAWETYLMDRATDIAGNEIDGEYVSILFDGETVDQRKSWVTTGSITEYVLSAGLNFNHKLYLGATVGIHDVYYKKSQLYSEQLGDDSFSYRDRYLLTGNGFNLKLGAIYKPSSSVRLGFAFHTPTYYQLDEENNLIMSSQLADSYMYEGTNVFGYDFRTPMKAVFSGAFVINKVAIISFDAEYLDYASMRYSDGIGGDDMDDINIDIDRSYEQVFNFRVGGELRVTDQISVQAGYEYYGEPFKSNVSIADVGSLKNELSSVSFGAGYSYKNFFIDAAFKQYTKNTNIFDQQPNFSNLALDSYNRKLMMTFGFRF